MKGRLQAHVTAFLFDTGNKWPVITFIPLSGEQEWRTNISSELDNLLS